MIIVENGVIKMNSSHLDKLAKNELVFDDFIRLGLLEYLDVNEEDNALIALDEDEIN